MNSRRYLRAFLFDAHGKLLPPLMKSGSISTALLPVMKLPGMMVQASELLEPSPKRRRKAAIDTLVTAQMSRHRAIYGVALVCCPDRRLSAQIANSSGRNVAVTSSNGYLGSFAIIGAHNQIWSGDTISDTLADLEAHIQRCVTHVIRGHSVADFALFVRTASANHN